MEQQKETPYRVGEWLPSDRLVLENWLKDLIVEVENTPKPMHPVILELKDLIESDPKLFMLFTLMFQQVPEKYKHNPAGGHRFVTICKPCNLLIRC